MRAEWMSALSLLARPMAWDAARVDTGYARGRECSGLLLGPRLGLVPARARRGQTTAPREGREAQAGVKRTKAEVRRRAENPSSSERGVELHA